MHIQNFSSSAVFRITQSSKPDIWSPPNSTITTSAASYLATCKTLTFCHSDHLYPGPQKYQALSGHYMLVHTFQLLLQIILCLHSCAYLLPNFLWLPRDLCEHVLMSVFLNLSICYEWSIHISLSLCWELLECWDHNSVILVSQVLCTEPGAQQVLIRCSLHTWLGGWVDGWMDGRLNGFYCLFSREGINIIKF